MMDIVLAVQERFGCVSPEAVEIIARECGTYRVEVESCVSFYSFLSMKPRGKLVIRLCNDIVDWMKGADDVAEAMAKELGIMVGQTTLDGAITLTRTPCIGMFDQAPAALINDTVVTNLFPERARHVIRELRKTLDPTQPVTMTGDPKNRPPFPPQEGYKGLPTTPAFPVPPMPPGGCPWMWPCTALTAPCWTGECVTRTDWQ